MKKSLYLVDLFSFIFRAYYAVRPLNAPDGTPVNAVYGVITMLKKLIEEKRPDHIAVCLDSPEPTFREEIFTQYKANRSAPPEDLARQIELIIEFVKSYPLPCVNVPGFEADDVIATLARKFARQQDLDVTIVSSDKDLMQLVTGNVFIYDTMKVRLLKHDAVVEKFGVPPDKVVDVQSLAGDSTDNIPGIPGVGIKTAAKLINEYGSLENVLEHASAIKGKLGENLRNNRESALISRQLVTLKDDVPIKLEWADLTAPKADQATLENFYRRLGFKSLIGATSPAPAPAADEASPASPSTPTASTLTASATKLVTITLLAELKQALAGSKNSALFAFDTETDALNTMTANLVGLSFCHDGKTAYYIPVAHKMGTNIDIEPLRELLGPVLTDAGIPKAAQNAKFDLNVLHRHGFAVHGLTEDTMIASYLIDPEGAHSLDTLAKRYLNHAMLDYDDVVKKNETFADVDIKKATKYAADDAWVAQALVPTFTARLKATGTEKIYRDVEVPLVGVLARMERHGVLVDREMLHTLGVQFSARLLELEKRIHAAAGTEFNINSTKQLGDILFNKLNLPVIKKTKTGVSTDVDVLTALAPLHELPRLLLEYRTLSKLQSTYVEQLTQLINPETRRIHTTYNQTVAATGRLSSSDPNLQNIPIRTPEGRKIREVFVAPKGHVILSADYSQIELRLLAAFSHDPGLVDAYRHNHDIHRKTAAAIFGVFEATVTDDQRAAAKTVNFGVVYGQGAFGLAQQLGVQRYEAQQFIDRFYEEFAEVRRYREEILAKARVQGFVETYLGRRRYLPEINSRNRMAAQNAERAAFNTVFQGSAADLIKKAMLDIDAWISREQLGAKMIMQVHDELIFEVPRDEVAMLEKHVPRLMESAFKLDVPLKVSCGHGPNWGAAH